eukprot:7851987-Alexandrium_andersonii.AAC.1
MPWGATSRSPASPRPCPRPTRHPPPLQSRPPCSKPLGELLPCKKPAYNFCLRAAGGAFRGGGAKGA